MDFSASAAKLEREGRKRAQALQEKLAKEAAIAERVRQQTTAHERRQEESRRAAAEAEEQVCTSLGGVDRRRFAVGPVELKGGGYLFRLKSFPVFRA